TSHGEVREPSWAPYLNSLGALRLN
ncbi:hypothetical protein ACI2KS_01860, partial [Pseudomonas sp. NPDC087358]